MLRALPGEHRVRRRGRVVRERKGEHAQGFEQLRAQGFIRARVDGVVYELDQVPALALRQKHSIEAVIDRFKPRADLKQRLAESFETALRLGDGMVLVRDIDDDGSAELLFSSRSEEHTSELQSLMRISYAVFCLKKKNNTTKLTE